MNVKELKKYLESLPEDMEIVVKTSDKELTVEDMGVYTYPELVYNTAMKKVSEGNTKLTILVG